MQPDIIDLPSSASATPIRPVQNLRSADEWPATQVVPPSASRKRSIKVASAACGILGIVAAGGIWVYTSHPQHRTLAGLQNTVQVSAATRSATTAPRVGSQRSDVERPDAEMHELMAMQAHTGPAPLLIQAPNKTADVPPSRLAPADPRPNTAGAVLPNATVVTRMPPDASAQEVGGHSKAAAPILAGDAADRAAHLQAAPLAPQEQIEVLNLVNEEATLIRQQREQLAELRKDQLTLHSTVDTSLADFSRRLSLREATDGIIRAQAVQMTPSVAPSAGFQASLSRARKALGTSRDAAPPATAPSVPAVTAGPHSYRIQAASPSLAMLVDDNPAPGTSGAIQVQVNDTLPGYGRVKSIGQRGTEWVVRTDRGIVQ